ncbi:hypothetical protein LJ656_26785 [Paraburkholderia sp. MMS20-SJTR3]|uniref:OmpA family protein n=1 Tax=Paraburkholderia sejongensis TaxID=2886946 RepID=A0ABS8K223_9BURK|nr:hypothetical protein [Paraburkholderia sp. MMS20-SJTR3]MCC8396200.1 hypothetical protein [Paraburkholderia sp. MMS20-SJTR3]
MNSKSLLLALCLLSFNAPACETSQNLPGQNIDVYFERNSARLPGAQILKLADWVIEMRKFPIKEVMSVGGVAEQSERKPFILASQRADAVRAMLMQFGLTGIPYGVRSGIYKQSPYLREPPEKVRRVEIMLVPGCPNNCCDGYMIGP